MAEREAGAARVLLLARAGEARQRVESALEQAGAELLRTVDPNEGDPAEAVALRPGAVLVALEAAIEDGLERYDALLSDPGVLVMFEEAEVAANRDGWDAARWVRHLAAKLNGHQDVLPPGAGTGDVARPAADASRGPDVGLSQDASPVASVTGFEGLLAAEDMDWSSSGDFGVTVDADPELAALLAAASAAQVEGPADSDAGSRASAPDWTMSLVEDEDADADVDVDVDGTGSGADSGDRSDATDAVTAPVDPMSLGSGLSLVEDDSPIVARVAPTPTVDFDALAARLGSMSLVDPDSPGGGDLRGAVMIEAGLGGPDAVRQLLGGLGDELPRAVLVRLQLDGGRYDRLVQQMQRATPAPVALAEAGASADPGTVYFLPPGIVAVESGARLVFADADGGDGYGSLTPGDSALVFLSGADTARVDRAMEVAAAGALVLAQAPDTCYDAAAVDVLVARGAVSAEPGSLAQALLDHWSS
jgi:chemosensory pili system protein ChpB (putative protein-glutamate methylesterase)